MATVRREILVDVPLDEVWDAVSDFGALHERLASGFATATQLEGEDRIVTFFNGAVRRERLISSDDQVHRLAWTIVDGPWTHHNGSIELLADSKGKTRLVWTTDILPHETAVGTGSLIDHACPLIKATLERNHAPE
jgi:polyketide cyclase/dehydrase/lipid transport protein